MAERLFLGDLLYIGKEQVHSHAFLSLVFVSQSRMAGATQPRSFVLSRVGPGNERCSGKYGDVALGGRRLPSWFYRAWSYRGLRIAEGWQCCGRELVL